MVRTYLVNLSVTPHAVRGDERLSQAQAAVARGNFRVRENLESCRGQVSYKVFKEENILERAAAQANSIETALPSHALRCGRQRRNQTQMKTPTQDSHGNSRAEVA